MNMAPPAAAAEAVGMTKVPLLARVEDVDMSEVLDDDGVAGPAGDGAAVDMAVVGFTGLVVGQGGAMRRRRGRVRWLGRGWMDW